MYQVHIGRADILAVNAATVVGLSLIAPAVNLFELPSNLALSPAEYISMRRRKRGQLWNAVLALALISTLIYAGRILENETAFILCLAASGLLLTTILLLWLLIQPLDLGLQRGTVLPESFESLQRQWEYGHAAVACLALLAFVAILLSIVAAEVSRLA